MDGLRSALIFRPPFALRFRDEVETMNPDKQHRKLVKLKVKAEECLTREQAQKIIRKADKAHRKLSEGHNNAA